MDKRKWCQQLGTNFTVHKESEMSDKSQRDAAKDFADALRQVERLERSIEAAQNVQQARTAPVDSAQAVATSLIADLVTRGDRASLQVAFEHLGRLIASGDKL
jgi:hypothetical protein